MTVLRDVAAVLIFVAVVAAAVFVLWLRHMVKRHGALVLIGRWHLGRPLNGNVMTNATFTRRATKTIHPLARDHGWHHRPGWQRLVIVGGAEVMLLLAVIGLFAARTLTLAALAAVAAGLLLFAVVVFVVWLRTREHNRHYVTPFELALTERVGYPPVICEVFRDENGAVTGARAEWAPEHQIMPAHEELALEAATARLPIEDPDAAWNVKGRNRVVEFTESKPPPALWPGKTCARPWKRQARTT